MKTGFDFPGFDTVKAVPEATGGGQGVDEKNFVCGRNKFALRTKFFSSADEIRPVLFITKDCRKDDFHHERMRKRQNMRKRCLKGTLPLQPICYYSSDKRKRRVANDETCETIPPPDV